MSDSSRTTAVAVVAVAVAVVLAVSPRIQRTFAAEPLLTLRAVSMAAATAEAPLTIELFRWSTDAERMPLLEALSAPPPAPPAAAPSNARGGGRGRGGRGAGPPPSPLARLTSATKAAPTVGFIWGDGPTGYSIKYAWRSATPDGGEHIVLVTDRRVDAQSGSTPALSGAAADAEFTVIEIRIDGKGVGEGKMSLTGGVVVDAAAGTLALDQSAAPTPLLKVTR